MTVLYFAMSDLSNGLREPGKLRPCSSVCVDSVPSCSTALEEVTKI